MRHRRKVGPQSITRVRVPDELRERMCALVGEHGVRPTAQRLHLSDNTVHEVMHPMGLLQASTIAKVRLALGGVS